MVFITGPLYAGKQTLAMAQWGLRRRIFPPTLPRPVLLCGMCRSWPPVRPTWRHWPTG